MFLWLPCLYDNSGRRQLKKIKACLFLRKSQVAFVVLKYLFTIVIEKMKRMYSFVSKDCYYRG